MFAVDGDSAKGSGRSIAGFNLFGALENCSGLLEKFGGHELAAGLTIKAENIEAFRKKKINEYAKGSIEDMTLVPTISLDAQIKVPYITIDTVHDINKLQPFWSKQPNAVVFCPQYKDSQNQCDERGQTSAHDPL